MSLLKSSLVPASIVLSSFFAAGCSKGPEIGEVEGVVKWNGQPVPFAYVVFQPVDPPGTYGSAYTNESGEYRLQFSESRNGALVGKHKVTIRTSAKDEIEVEDRTTGKMIKPPLPKGYQEKVELTFDREVASGENSVDFDLAQGS
jgi:hypothetical protein